MSTMRVQRVGRTATRPKGAPASEALPARELWRSLYLSERVQWLRETGYPRVAKKERLAFRERFESALSEKERRLWPQWRKLQRITVDEHVAAARPHPPTRQCPLKPQPWRDTLAEILSVAGLTGPFEVPGLAEGAMQVLLGPFACWAKREIEQSLGSLQAAGLEMDEAPLVAGLMGDLMGDLSRAATRTLVLELNVARVRGGLEGETPAERIRSFAAPILSSPSRLRALYLRYPVLARILATHCHSWVRGVREMLAAYAADREEIRSRIFEGRDPGRIVALAKESGDPHEGGRRVRILKFESGARVVFKPRALDVDEHFQRIVEWMNEDGLAAKLPTLKILRRPHHGWTSFASPEAATDREAIKRYYYRLGAFLPLLWIIRGTDFHYENVIASGDAPMLIDLEMLFCNTIAAPMRNEPPAQKLLRLSVLEAGILPSQPLSAARERPSEDVSAIGKRSGQVWKSDFDVVRDVGTDEVRFERGTQSLPSSPNLPCLGTTEVTVAGYEGDLLAGFRDAYVHLERNREVLLRRDGPLGGAARAPVRYVVRPTIQYAILLDRACHPHRLADALQREYYLAPRLAGFLNLSPSLANIVAREFEELIGCDVPRFSTLPGSRSLWHSDGREVKRFFRTSAVTLCEQRIRSLSAIELQRQSEIARLSVSTLSVGMPPPAAPEPGSADASYDQDALLEEARQIGLWCHERVIVEGRTAEWLGLLQSKDVQTFVAPSGPSLYGGAAGLALFLAYLTRIDPRREVEDLALAAAALTRRQLSYQPGAGGAFDGRGGMAYALLHVGTVLGRPELVAAALSSLLAVADHAKRDDTLDVIGGSAGLIAVLLAFADATRSTKALDVAVAFGRRLVKKRVDLDRGCGWPNAIESVAPLTGFAHGAAGIAWALMRLAAATGDRRFATVGRQGLHYEQSTFDQAHGNWPDLRHSSGHQHGDGPMAWCYGAPGIGLSRMTLPASAIGDQERREIDFLVKRTNELPVHANDSMCHGELGNLETLVSGSERLGRPDLLESARRRAMRALARRRSAGHWRCGLEGTHEAVPGLFLGMSGVGYQLLRLADPSRVPSVLAIEPPRSANP